ncbi:MAG: hypothetical protein ABW321_16790, partial [Polyangiales bacterium]
SVTVDAALRAETRVHGHAISASAFLSNVADQRYWAYYRSGAGLLIGAPRVLSVSAKVAL